MNKFKQIKKVTTWKCRGRKTALQLRNHIEQICHGFAGSGPALGACPGIFSRASRCGWVHPAVLAQDGEVPGPQPLAETGRTQDGYQAPCRDGVLVFFSRASPRSRAWRCVSQPLCQTQQREEGFSFQTDGQGTSGHACGQTAVTRRRSASPH